MTCSTDGEQQFASILDFVETGQNSLNCVFTSYFVIFSDFIFERAGHVGHLHHWTR